MSLPRPLLSFLAALGLLLLVQPIVAQQAPGPKDKPASPVDLPLLDTPPTLTLPVPKPGPASGQKQAPTAENVPAPALRPVQPTLPPPAVASTESSTSAQGQFVVHGADLEARTFVTQVCEDVSQEVTMLLRDAGSFGFPIVVVVKTPPNLTLGAPSVTTDISPLAYGGFHLQITIQVRPDFNILDFKAELVRMLIAQRILRDHKEITSKRARILPNWLLVGIKEALRYRGRSRPSAVFASVFRTGKVYSIEEILETAPGSLDALSRAIYETSCCALVLTLLDQPEGSLRMTKFLNALATDSRTEREMLNQWFPGLNVTKSSLNKWWSLQMASLATPSVFESLGPSETAKELDQALMLHYQTTPADAPPVHLASASVDPELNAEAEKEAKKRSFITRMFNSEKMKAETEAATKPKSAAVAASKPKTEKPEPKKPLVKTETKKDEDRKEEDKNKDKPAAEAPAKRGSWFSNLFGATGTAAAEEDKDKKDIKSEKDTKPEPKKDSKPEPKKDAKPEPKKDAKPEPKKDAKPEPKKDAKPEPKKDAKPEPKKDAKPEPKKDAKPEPKKDAKPEPKKDAKPEPKKDATPEGNDEPKKQPGFFGRIFSGNTQDNKAKEDKKAEPSDDKSKKDKDHPKDKKKDGDKPTAAILLRAIEDLSAPGLSTALDLAQWLGQEDNGPRYTFLGFGKKKDPAEPQAPDPDAGKKADAKSNPKKKVDTEARNASEKPKEEPKPQVKKEKEPPHLVSVTVPLTEYARIMKRGDAKLILGNTANSLSALATHAHPLFRPLITEYLEIIADLTKHKNHDVDARLKALKERRDQALLQAKAVRDYLDWYEASETSDYSGTFDDYLRLPKAIEQEISPRGDPISKLLDEAEKKAGP